MTSAAIPAEGVFVGVEVRISREALAGVGDCVGAVIAGFGVYVGFAVVSLLHPTMETMAAMPTRVIAAVESKFFENLSAAYPAALGKNRSGESFQALSGRALRFRYCDRSCLTSSKQPIHKLSAGHLHVP